MAEKRLFPASIVDEITYCAERAYHNPLIYTWSLLLEGEVHTEVLLKALDDTLTYYPKCKCVLTNNYPSWKRWFRYRWEYQDINAGDLLQEIAHPHRLLSDTEVINYYMHTHSQFSLDPSRSCPFKLVVLRYLDKVALMFIFNHAVADGMGSFSFIQQFIQSYEDIFYQKKTLMRSPADLSAVSLPAIQFHWKHFTPRRLYPCLKYNACQGREPLLPLYAPEEVKPSGRFLTVVRGISPHQLSTIRNRAKMHHATINEYLLATMFHTIKKWHRHHDKGSGRISITVPMNLRLPGDRTLSNILSGVMISFSAHSLTTREQLLPLIRQEMISLLNHDIARTMLHAACVLKPIPLALKPFMVKRLASAFPPTLLLSNMGILSPNDHHKDEEGFHYMGSSRIAAIYGIPSAGEWPGVAFFTYNECMTFSLAVLSSYFPQETAEHFLESFIEALV